MPEIPEEMQKSLQEFQMKQQQARLLASQRYQIEMQLREIENAIKELEKAKSAEVHKAIGQILIKADPAETLKELKERKESFDLRLKTLQTKENSLTGELKSLQDGFQEIIGKGG